MFFKPSDEALSKKLCKAIENGNLARVRDLVEEKGANIHLSHYSRTPLSYAAWYGRSNILQYLLEKGADVNPPQAYSSPLIDAVRDGGMSGFNMLLQAGAKVNYANDSGYTALHQAAERGRLSMVKALIEHGAEASATTEQGLTALDLALKADRKDVVRYLDELYKTSVNRIDDDWRREGQDELVHISDKLAARCRVTEIFNFRARTYTQIVRDLDSGQQSHALRTFSECHDMPVLLEAAERMRSFGVEVGEIAGPRTPVMLPAPAKKDGR